MMRAPDATSVAVRKADGSLVVRVRTAHRLGSANRWLARPGVRGIAVLVETLQDGMSALNFSARQALPEGEDAGPAPSSGAIAATLAVSMAFGFFMFAVLPHLLTFGIGWLLASEDLSGGQAVVFHLVDGVLKASIFLAFVWTMSRVKDMRRVFEYHGAEHQAVHAFEAGQDLCPENLSKHPTEHARCGTAFLVTVIFVSILVFAGVFPLLPVLSDIRILNQLLYVLIKAPLILPIGGLSYEVIRYAGKAPGGLLGRIVSAPGVWFQHITTQPPDRGQQEVAVVALAAALDPARAGIWAGFGEVILPFATYDDFCRWLDGDDTALGRTVSGPAVGDAGRTP